MVKLSELDPKSVKEVKKPGGGSGGVLGFTKGLGVGLAKSAGELALGIGELGYDIGRPIQRGFENVFLGGRSLAKSVGFDDSTSSSILKSENAQTIRENVLKSQGTAEGIGKFAGTTAQYLAPTGYIARGQQVARGLAMQIPTMAGSNLAIRTAAKTAQLAGRGAARFVPEAAGAGSVAFVRSGGDVDDAFQEGLISGGASVAFGTLGALGRATYWPTLEDSVSKAFGTQGKKSAGIALADTAKKISGLQVLKEQAKNLTVKNADGIDEVFDPLNASYSTTLQAWNEARKKIYNGYATLSEKAGEKITADLTNVRQNLVNAFDAPITGSELNAVKSLLKDFDRIFPDPTNIDLKRAEQFIESLNRNIAKEFFAGTSEAASSMVNAGTSRLIRETLDKLITESTGAGYQNLRSQYAALKTLESDLVRKFQQDARSIGGGLAEYTGAFATGDIIGSALSLDPAQFAKGATLGIFATLKRKLSNPERYLRRSFDLLDDVPSALSQRIWGGTTAGRNAGASTDDVFKSKKKVTDEPTAQGGQSTGQIVNTAQDVTANGAPVSATTDGTQAVSQMDNVIDVTPQAVTRELPSPTQTATNQVSAATDNLATQAAKAKLNEEYVYHGTSEDNIESIAKNGLRPGRRGQLSLSVNEEYARTYAETSKFPAKKGQGVMYRINANYLKGKTTTSRVDGKTRPLADQQNELLTKETIPPEALEIWENGQWVPLTKNNPTPPTPKPKPEKKPKVSKSKLNPEVDALTNTLRILYRSAEPTNGFDSSFIQGPEDVLNTIFLEMDLAEAGYRYVRESDGEVLGVPSTFPEWVPEELRRKDLFKKVFDRIDLQNLQYPTGNRKAQRRLYDAILDELDARLGVDTKAIRNNILKNYGQGELYGVDSGSTARGSGAREAGGEAGGGGGGEVTNTPPNTTTPDDVF